ncbi:hypothetical protein A0J61_03607 [Choanephora cucurbitarum]|uniref:COX assembly mitochondrial protein n=1 Tax=Choanephora cucurbitarum TaxID=101091 RepID=A0A1C7NHV7_9FUNG|nr:hypothetical protein A0J61_03607 [Choanephora cucurbitarum]
MGKSQEETMSNPFISKHSELHALTRQEEENCNKELKANALEACQLPIRDFVTCSKEHNVTVMWTCRNKLKTMNNCLKERTTQQELDKLLLAKLAKKRSDMHL